MTPTGIRGSSKSITQYYGGHFVLHCSTLLSALMTFVSIKENIHCCMSQSPEWIFPPLECTREDLLPLLLFVNFTQFEIYIGCLHKHQFAAFSLTLILLILILLEGKNDEFCHNKEKITKKKCPSVANVRGGMDCENGVTRGEKDHHDQDMLCLSVSTYLGGGR